MTDSLAALTGAGEGRRALTTFDVRWACDVLHPVCGAAAGGQGLFIKIPAARQGLPAMAACLAEAISISVTLIFSLARYGEVMDVFPDGMEQARDAGHDLSAIASVASFLASRADAGADARLDKAGTAEAAAPCGRAATANARLTCQRYEWVFSSPRWKALRAGRARPQRPLWASTPVKDPALSRHPLRDRPAGPGVVNTMPADSVHGRYDQSRMMLGQLRGLGIDHDEVVQAFEDDGVARFDASWDQLGKRLASTMRRQSANR